MTLKIFSLIPFFLQGIFGRYLQHASDRFCLTAMVEHLISLSAVKKDFEYSKSESFQFLMKFSLVACKFHT